MQHTMNAIHGKGYTDKVNTRNIKEATALDKIGIIGGMGPMATAKVFMKLVESVDALNDLDHPEILSSEPLWVITSAPIQPSAPYGLIGYLDQRNKRI